MSKAKKKKRKANSHTQTQPERRVRPQIPLHRKLLFASITTVAVFTFLEAALWLVGVKPAWVDEDPYAGFSRHIPHFVDNTDAGEPTMSVSPSKDEVLNPQSFAAKKPDGVRRIVCLGGSTTYGRPFFDLTSFPGWLRAYLAAGDPQQKWEVINAGGISYASYRVLGVMEELASYEPDIFIVYTGQNEFLERRTYDGWTAGSATAASLIYRTRTATIVRGALDAAGLRETESERSAELGEETDAIPIDAVGPDAYHRDDELQEEVVTHFQSTLAQMRAVAKDCGAEILFVVPASNLQDFAPFRSQHSATVNETDRKLLEEKLGAARDDLLAGNAASALERLKAAETIDPRYAETWYLKGKALATLERYEDAREAFLRARDEDVCPLRAIQPIVDSVRDLAADNVSVVDFEQAVYERSPHGLPGDQMFHDHVHPTIEGNQLLAMAIVEALRARGQIGANAVLSDAQRAAVDEAVLAKIDREEYGRQLRLLAFVMSWLGQPDTARTQANLSFEYSGRTEAAFMHLAAGMKTNKSSELSLEYLKLATEAVPDSPTASYRYAIELLESGSKAAGVDELKRTVQLAPRKLSYQVRLGVELAQQGELADAETHLRAAVSLKPDSPSTLTNLGLIIAKQGRMAEALEQYDAALKLDNSVSSTHLNAGIACEELGRFEQARKHYSETIRLANGHAEAEQRLHRILNK